MPTSPNAEPSHNATPVAPATGPETPPDNGRFSLTSGGSSLVPRTGERHPTPGPAPTAVRRIAAWLAHAAGTGKGWASTHPSAATLAALIVLTILAAGAINLGTEIYEWAIAGGAAKSVDAPVLKFMVEHRTPDAAHAVTVFTHLGGPVFFPLIALAIVVALVVRTRSPHRPIVLVVGTLTSLLITLSGKELTQRARPDHAFAVPPYESTYSFPSGHTINATAFAMLVGYTCWHLVRSRAARTLLVTGCVLWALGMGLSRVYLGHHWLTDVLAGFAFGFAWSVVVIVLDYTWILLRARHRQQHLGEASHRQHIDQG